MMSGLQPPIAVRDILAMDVAQKNKTADEYCRQNQITDPRRRYEGHTRWLNWNELDSFYWHPQLGVSTAWRASLEAKGDSPSASDGNARNEKVHSSVPSNGMKPKVSGGKPLSSQYTDRGSRSGNQCGSVGGPMAIEDNELFVPMDVS